MNKQIKLFLIFLAVSAVVSVFSFFDVFGGARSVQLHDPPEPLKLDISIDVDQDGLSDSDESYWNTDFQNPDSDGDGFLDGEEVASGYDPREPSSHELGDSLRDTVYGAPKEITPDFNITEDIAAMMFTGAYAGDLRRDADPEKFKNGINALSFSVIDNFYKTQTLPSVTTVIVDDSLENQTAYVETVAQIVKSDLLDLPQKLNLGAGITNQLSFFAMKSGQFKVSYEKIAALSVPKDWQNIHTNIINFLYRSYLNYLYISGYEADMLKATVALADLSGLNTELPTLLRAIQTKITENNLSIDNSLYQIMNLLYKE